jgi:hypothetical protein
MRLFRDLQRIALCGLLAAAFTACSSNQQAAQIGPGIVPGGQGAWSKITPDKGVCTGVNQVTVAPCPIRLTRQNYKGVTVTVSAPGIAAAQVKDPGGCQDGICVITRLHRNHTQFRVESGTICNVAHPVFGAYNASRQLIGTATLTVINRIDSQTGDRC